MKCIFCNKEYKNKRAVAAHKALCKLNPDRKIIPIPCRKGKNNPNWGKKGSNQYTKNPDYVMSEETRKKLKEIGRRQVWTEQMRKKHSTIMSDVVIKYPESYRHGNKNGRTKIYEVNGFKLRGTWEVIVAEYLNSEGIKWTNKVEPKPYMWQGKFKTYYPDFYIPEIDMYIEVKGYETDRDRAKWTSIDNLIVIKKKEIEKIKKNEYNIREFLV